MNVKDLRIRDPFIIKENGHYYLTGTTNKKNFLGFISDDLENFSDPILLFDPEKYGINTSCAWAPEIHKYKDKYYLFFTIKDEGKKRGTYIASSDTIFGEYELISKDPITPSDWECLDGTLFVDNNIPYLIFCHEWLEVRNGEILIVQLSDDLTSRVGEPKLLFKAHDTPWSTPIFGDGYVTDGPFVFKEDNKYKMLWSSFYKDKYALSIISSNSLLSGYQQEELPFIKEDAGHGMIFFDGDVKYLVLHYPNNKPNERLKLIELK